MEQVHQFFGWAVFSLSNKLKHKVGERIGKIKLLLDAMTVYHSDVIDDTHYMEHCYPKSEQVRNKGGLSLVSKKFIPFGRHLLKNVGMLNGNQSFQQKGNTVIEDMVRHVANNYLLRKIFGDCCNGLLGENGAESDNKAVMDQLYVKLCTKTIHSWGGEMTAKYKERYLGRHVKNATKLAFRVQLDADTQAKEKNKKKDKESKDEKTKDGNDKAITHQKKEKDKKDEPEQKQATEKNRNNTNEEGTRNNCTQTTTAEDKDHSKLTSSETYNQTNKQEDKMETPQLRRSKRQKAKKSVNTDESGS